MMKFHFSGSFSSVVLWLLLLSNLTGCVRRRMTVRTSPPGAMVYVDHQNIGTTPVSANFTYYGTRQFEIIKDGYRTEKFLRRFNPPWYEWPGLDFISETLWPYEKRDERIIDVQLSPETDVPTEALIRSGEDLRSQASRGVIVSSPPTVVGPNTTPPLSIVPTPAQSVVPTGPPPFIPNANLPGQPPNPNFQGPSFFDTPPASIPSTQVTPGPSYRP
jgi:hypothetical protein